MTGRSARAHLKRAPRRVDNDTMGSRWRRRQQRRPQSDEGGFSLIEVIVAIALFLVISAAFLSNLDTTSHLNYSNRARSVAASLAEREVELARATDINALNVGTPITRTNIPDFAAYSVLRDTYWVADSVGANVCDTSSGYTSEAFVHVTVTVTWPQMRGVKPVRTDTNITPRIGAYHPTTGNLAVTVLDRAGNPLANRPVTVTGGGAKTTDSAGCAYFAELLPGQRTASLAAAGYVDFQGNASPAQTVTIQTGTTKFLTFNYDREANLVATIGTDATYPAGTPLDSSYQPNGRGVPLIVANTNLQPNGQRSDDTPATTRTLPGLFPFADGYGTWTGACSDAKPASPVLAAMTPGATTTVAVPLARVSITATVVSGKGDKKHPYVRTPAADKDVYAIHDTASGQPDIGCPDGARYYLGRTDANGRLNAALPGGRWIVAFAGSQGVVTTTVQLDSSAAPVAVAIDQP